ncbi:cubilin-like, partial [Tetranychus urticae]
AFPTLIFSFDPFSTHARIRVEDGNIVFEAPPRKSISFKSNLGTIYVNGDKLDNLVSKSSSSSSTSLSTVSSDGSSIQTYDQKINSLKDSVDKLNEYSDVLNKARLLFSPGRRQFSPKDFRRAVYNITRLTSEFNRLKQRLEENFCSSNPCRNGGICIPSFQSYICECREGWEGVNCDLDVNECLTFASTDLGCQNGASCVNLPGTYQCNCLNGFFGVHCTQRSDDCASASNEALCGHGICLSTGKPAAGKPHYTCLCDQGWTTDGVSPACRVDVDECASPMPHCSINPPVDCINYPGGFTCGPCPAGYKKQGFYCVDIDECQVNNGGCSISPRVQCRNLPGGKECGSCPPGFAGDGISCSYVGVCSIRNGDCSPVAQCVEISASAGPGRECRCPAGYIGNGEGANGCLPSTSTTCDQNPCVVGICIPVSSNPPSFTCQCPPSFTGKRCDTQISNSCDPNPCLNGGTCINDAIGPICLCKAAYQGTRCQDQRSQCTGDFDSPTGVISFPDNGDEYPQNAVCNWRIRTSLGKVIQVTFTKLDIEPSYDCHSDSISLYDGLTSTAPVIGKYCGQLSNLPENHTITSEQPYLLISFTSDMSNQGSGFSLNWTTVTPECGGVINGTEYGAITSPGYPDKYPPGRDCYWYIHGTLGKRIVFHFALLSLEIHPDCKFDFLRIYDGHSDTDPILGNYCNTTSPSPLTTSGPSALVHFHSDRNRQDSGFHITFATIPAISGCGGLLTGDRGALSTPSFPNRYEGNLECDWVIRIKSLEDRIELRFNQFDLEHHPNCRYDYVEIRDGEQQNAPLIGRYCSTTIKPPVPILSTSNKLFVRFRSDWSREGTGFHATYEVFCGGYFTDDSGTISSPNYPLLYPNSKNCTYHIRVPPGKIIQLSFTFFDLENSPDCIFDYVAISEPGILATNLTRQLCGSEIPEMITSNLNELIITFKTDSRTNRHGFRANYSSIDASCGGVLRDKNGIITSPSHPNEYAHGKECVWLLSAPKGHVVQLTFTMFNLEGGRKCSYDYVEVMEKNMNFGRFCGNQIPSPIQSVDEQLIVRFKSDSSVSFEGFVAAYSFLNGSKFCGGIRRGLSGEIVSPNYPLHYPKSRRCLWKIIAPENNQLQIKFTDINIEFHNSCTFDYIEIYNGLDTSAPLIGKYCGNKLPPSIISHSNTVTIQFITDSGVSGHGFKLTYNVAGSGCGGLMRSASGVIISPNYPYPYNHDAECTWVIKTSKGSRLTLNLVDLSLEPHSDCAHDRLEIYDGPDSKAQRLLKACGDTLIGEPLKSSANVVTVKMITDGSISFRGFKLSYATNCSNTINDLHGVIESPNYPDLFSSNSNCSWTIKVPQGNNISLAFQDTHFNSPCTTSYLSITNSTSNAQLFSTKSIQYCIDNATISNLFIPSSSVSIDYINIGTQSSSSFRLEWSMVGCGGYLTADRGEITSPGYPNPYPHRVTCQWTIKAKPGYKISLSVFDYFIESSTTCNFDSLQIFSGPDLTSPRLLKLCGRSLSSKTLSSNGNYMTIFFSSDDLIAGKGFRLTYYTEPGTCGGYQNLDEGTITSPNYPLSYDSSDDCEWILGFGSDRIKITIQDLDIPSSANCTESFLAFYSDSSNKLAQLCGNEVPTEQIISPSSNIRVRFKANGKATGKGFKFLYQVICGGDRIAEEYPKVIRNPNYPSISNKNPSCDWVIRTNKQNPGKRIMWRFIKIISAGSGSLELREGDSRDSPLIAKYTDSSHPLPVITQGNSLFVHLTGPIIFSASYSTDTSQCGGTFTGFTGNFASPGYPNSYPLSTTCIWKIKASSGNRVSLTFLDFNFESDEFCALDYVEIREGSASGQLIGRFCGQSIPPIQNSSYYAGLWIKFQSDGDGSAPGFQASFDTSTNVELTGDSGYISSPAYPEYYATKTNQRWSVTVKDGLTIAFRFNTISLIPRFTECERNYVAIYDGPDWTYPLLGRFCGFQVNGIKTTSSNIATVFFRPDSTLSRFLIFWKAEAKNVTSLIGDLSTKPSNCSYFLSSQLGQSIAISSPGYPFGYSPNINCSWFITAPSGTHFKVNVTDLNIEHASSEVCNYDRLNFYQYSFEDSVWIKNRTICGKNKLSFELSTHLSQVNFMTDSHINKTGFNLTLTPVCGGVLNLEQAVINSSILGSAVSCSWKIMVRDGRTIELNFFSFNLGSGNPCTKGYMNIRNGPFENSPLIGHYCGANLPPVIQSDSNQMFISVYAPRTSPSDFSFNYREISATCGGSFDLDENTPSVTINSPGYPSLPPHALQCDWLFKGPAHRNLRIDFEIISGPSIIRHTCNKNLTRVDVHDGGTRLSPLIGRFCPRPQASGVTTTENFMFVRYSASGDLTLAPFKATISLNICGGTYFISSSVVIQSPNFPSPYDGNMNCGYYLHSYSTSSTVMATILSLDLPSESSCDDGDYLEFREISPTGDLIMKLCGTRNSTVTVQSTTSVMYVLFKSNSENAGQGFRISFSSYTDYENSCYNTFDASKPGIVRTPQSSLGHSLTCSWSFKAPVDRRISLTFTKYNLKQNTRVANSCLDSLEATFDHRSFYFSDIVPSEPNKLILPCGYQNEFSIKSPNNVLFLRFKTFSLGSGEGIEASFSASEPTECGGVVTKNSPLIVSTNFSKPVDGAIINCFWKIEIETEDLTKTKWIEYETIEVLGSDSSDAYCSKGKIAEGSVTDLDHSVGKLFCGNKTNQFSLISSKIASFGISARINQTKGYRGVKAMYRVNDCGGRITDPQGNFSSPGWPQGYPVNATCFWEFNYNYINSYAWQVEFTEFELEEDCSKDYVEIWEGTVDDPVVIGRYCGKSGPTSFVASNIVIVFRSNGVGSAKGFNVKFSLASRYCGGFVRASSNYRVRSANYPLAYPKNSECIWNIESYPEFRLNLTFEERFDIEKSANCTKDYVSISEWKGNSWKFIGQYCGLIPPKPLALDSYKARVVFHSDDDNRIGDGFTLTLGSICGFLVDEPGEGIISSPGSNGYRPGSNCVWTLKGQRDTDVIKIEFLDFDLEPHPSCGFDFVKLIRGNSSLAQDVIGTYCGSTKPDNVIVRGNLTIAFRSDTIKSHRGFNIKYQIIPCGGNFTQSSGKVTAPIVDDNYVNNAHCSYLITVPEDNVIMLRLSKIELYNTELCYPNGFVYPHSELDYLEIWDGPSRDSPLLRRLCGSSDPMIFKSSTNSLLLVFHSDEEYTSSGFEATWETTLGQKQGCGGILNGTSGSLESPDIDKDGRYENNLDCTWLIISDGKYDVLEITFSLMDIEASSLSPKIECANDFLEIRDGMSSSSPLIDVYCSSELPTKLLTSSSRAYIHFYSNEDTNGAGFRLTYKTVNQTCGGTLKVSNITTGIIASPNYPNSYPSSIRCFWHLLFDTGSAEISITFKDLDLDCDSKVSLEIAGHALYNEPHRICGTTSPPTFHISNDATFTFTSRSEVKTTRRGFSLEYKLAGCNDTYTEESGVITSQIYPMAYHYNGLCNFTIKASPGYSISVYFHEAEFSFNGMSNCNSTSLFTVKDGEGPVKSIPVCKLPDPIFSSNSSLTFKVNTEWYKYYMIYTTTNAGPGCGGNIRAFNGSFTSPSYPKPYSNESECTWNIFSYGYHALTFRFITFDFTSLPGCTTNYVELYDGSLVGRYCGSELPATYVSRGNTLKVKMVTSSSNRGNGFHANFAINQYAPSNLQRVISTPLNYDTNERPASLFDPSSGIMVG